MDPDRIALPSRFDVSPGRWEKMQAAASDPVEPRDATSVLLVRDRPDAGVEVFLQHRVAEMAFAGGMTAFPGGGASTGDRRSCPRAGPSAEEWAARWPDGVEESDPDTAVALVATAVRETFEESGVLLAGSDGSHLADPSHHGSDRAALTGGSRDLADVLEAAGLVLRDDLLSPFARWITPPGLPKRYDTRFLLAVVPDGQEADGRTTEAVATEWSTPAAAIAAFERSERALLPVTWAVLRDLGRFPDTASLVVDARERRPRPVSPHFDVDDDRIRFTIEAHAGAFLAEDQA